MNFKLNFCSLGQRQGDKAKKYTDVAKNYGKLIKLQSYHLALSWMPALERIVEDFENS